jgi:hypothetical protein
MHLDVLIPLPSPKLVCGALGYKWAIKRMLHKPEAPGRSAQSRRPVVFSCSSPASLAKPLREHHAGKRDAEGREAETWARIPP